MSKNSPAFHAAVSNQKPLDKINTEDPKVVAFRVSGDMDAKDYEYLNHQLGDVLEKEGQVHLYFEYVNLSGLPLASVWEDFKSNVPHYRDLKKLAFVSETSPTDWLAENEPGRMNFEPRHFSIGQKEMALNWLSE